MNCRLGQIYAEMTFRPVRDGLFEIAVSGRPGQESSLRGPDGTPVTRVRPVRALAEHPDLSSVVACAALTPPRCTHAQEEDIVTVAAPPRSALTRNQSLELLRIVAIFGVVLFHAHAPGGSVGYAGLVAFIVMSASFEVGLNWDRQRTVWSLARTFLVPWSVWLVVYGAVNIAKDDPVLLRERSAGQSILSGSAPHLWYLPFIFVALAGVSLLKARVPRPALAIWSWGAATVMLALVGFWRPWSEHVGAPVAQYAHGLFPLFAGLALGAAASRATWLWIFGTLCAGTLTIALLPYPGVGIAYLVGVVPTALLMRRPIRLPFDVEPVSRCTFGVYLAHPLALSLSKPVLRHHPFGWVAVSFLMALTGTWLLKRLLPSVANWVV